MAACARCGAELPSFSFGDASDLCRTCRAADRAERPNLPLPAVTISLIALNAIVFAAMVAGGVSALRPTAESLLAWGANSGPRTLGAEPWRLLTSMFLHVGAVHLLVNMAALWQLGGLAEKTFDRATFVTVYVLSGVAGSVAGVAWSPDSVSAGASGAIFGLIGLLIGATGSRAATEPETRRVRVGLVACAAYNLFIGAVVPMINNAAHVGGLVIGLLCGLFLVSRRTGRPGSVHRRVLVLGAAAWIVLVAAIATRAMRGDTMRIARAEAVFASRDFERAIDELTPLANARRDDARVQFLLTASLYGAHRYEEARVRGEWLVALVPRDAGSRALLGWTLISLRRERDAIPALREALSLDPDDRTARYGLGHALSRQGAPAEAIAVLEEGVRRDPNDAASKQLLAALQATTGDVDSAIAKLQAAVKADPGLVDAWALLGRAYETKGMGAEAREAYQRAHEAEVKAYPEGRR